MSKYTTRELHSDEFELWDWLVDTSTEGTIFHSPAWLRASGHKFSITGIFSGEQLIGGFARVSRTKYGIKFAGHPVLTPFLGPVFEDRDEKYASRLGSLKVLNGLVASSLHEGHHMVNVNLSPEIVDVQPYIWAGYDVRVRYTYRLSLDSLDSVWSDMSGSRRRNIRAAERDGIKVFRTDQISDVLPLVAKTYERQGTTAHFLDAALRYDAALKEMGQCGGFVAKDVMGEPIAACYLVWDQKRAYYLLGGYDFQRAHHGAMAACMWEAIRFTATELELREFDFEGSMVPQIERFFRPFGGRIIPYYSVSWVAPWLRLPFLIREQWIGMRIRNRAGGRSDE